MVTFTDFIATASHCLQDELRTPIQPFPAFYHSLYYIYNGGEVGFGTLSPSPSSLSLKIHLDKISTFRSQFICHPLQEAQVKVEEVFPIQWWIFIISYYWTDLYYNYVFGYPVWMWTLWQTLFYPSLYTEDHIRCSILGHIRCPIIVVECMHSSWK